MWGRRRLRRAAARPAPVRAAAPPDQRQRERKRAAMHGQQRRPHRRAPARHPGLAQVDEVVVDDEAEQGHQQAPVARPARVGGRQPDRQQQQVGRAEQQPEPPRQLALVRRGGQAQQRDARLRPRRQRGRTRGRLFADEDAVAAEARQGALAARQVLLVALALVELEEAILAFERDAARVGRGHRFHVPGAAEDEHVAADRAAAFVALDEKGARAVGGSLELAGRDARQVAAALVALAQLGALLVHPGPDEQREQRDHQQHRPGHAQHRADEARQAHAAGEPDHHLAVAVHAGQGGDHRHEQRQREHRRQVAERGVAEQQHHVLRRHAPAGGLAQRADQEHGQHDGQDDHERGPEAARQILAQSGIE
jgi:hypothetical protein